MIPPARLLLLPAVGTLRQMPSFAFWLVSAVLRVAEAQDSGAPGPTEEALPLPEEALQSQDPTVAQRERLDQAVTLYIDGELSAARDAVLRLLTDLEQSGSEVGPEADALHRDARVWLGEILYSLGDLQAAHSTFEVVALRWPDTHLDPFVHPPEVVAFYDSVLAAVQISRAPPPAPMVPPRAPPGLVLYALPGGLQFYNERPLLGSATLGSVTALAMTTVGMRVWLVAQDDRPGVRGLQVLGDQDDLERLRSLRAVQNTVGVATLAIWGAGVIQGSIQTLVQQRSGSQAVQLQGGQVVATF